MATIHPAGPKGFMALQFFKIQGWPRWILAELFQRSSCLLAVLGAELGQAPPKSLRLDISRHSLSERREIGLEVGGLAADRTDRL